MKFFKTFLASLLAVIVGFGLIVMMWTMILVGMVTSLASPFATTTQSVSSNSVLRLNLQTITDSPSSLPFDDLSSLFSLGKGSRTSLLKAISAIDIAAADDRIKGIYINFDEYANAPMTAVEEIRAALVRFKESGKFIVAYNENYGQTAYYLASVADKIYMNPEGEFDWRGMSVRAIFYKGLLDKLDVEPVIIRHGTFKAAVEPLMYEKMSPENRLQNQTVANSVWGTIVKAISESRNIPAADLQTLANTLAIDSPRTAYENGLVDGLRYEDQVMHELSMLIADPSWESPEVGAGENPVATSSGSEPRLIPFSDYASQAVSATSSMSRNKIAIVYADGGIYSGESAPGDIGSVTMAAKLAKVRKDPNVKAVVFRVNSPGGSALASEVIWREMQLLKEQVPVIVSMASYAASGGYYISCPADVIYANNTTITGSIGVFGRFFNAGKALQNKLGVTVDVVNTNEYSDIGSMYRAPAPAEMRYFQKSVEDVYKTFVGHVAQGRNMTYEAVDKIGEGRIWSGADAVNIGLVDGIGGINDAIAIAADRAGITDDFRLWEVMDEATGLASLFNMGVSAIRQQRELDAMGEMFAHYKSLKDMLKEEGVQARMPYVLEID